MFKINHLLTFEIIFLLEYNILMVHYLLLKVKSRFPSFLKLKNYINILQTEHVVYQYNSMKYKQIIQRNKNKSTQFLMIHFEN